MSALIVAGATPERAAQLALVERAAGPAQPHEELPLLHRQPVRARDAIGVCLREQVHAAQAAERAGPRCGESCGRGRIPFRTRNVSTRTTFPDVHSDARPAHIRHGSRARRDGHLARASRHGSTDVRAGPGSRRRDRRAAAARARCRRRRRRACGPRSRASARPARPMARRSPRPRCCATVPDDLLPRYDQRTRRTLPPRLTRVAARRARARGRRARGPRRRCGARRAPHAAMARAACRCTRA